MKYRNIFLYLLSALFFCLLFSFIKLPEAHVLGASSPTTPIQQTEQSSSTQTSDNTSDSEAEQVTEIDKQDNPEGYSYRNDFFHIACCLPSNWYVLNEQERQVQATANDQLLNKSDDYRLNKSSPDKFQTVVDFQATTYDGLQTIYTEINKTTFQEMFISERRSIESCIPIVQNMLQDVGVKNITAQPEEIQFAEREHTALFVQFDYQNVTFYEEIIYLRRGPYVITITVCSPVQEKVAGIMDYWKSLRTSPF